MHPDRLSLVGADSPRSHRRPAANAGIRLRRHDDNYLVVPVVPANRPSGGPTIVEPFILPKVPWPMLEYGCGWMRHVWEQYKRPCLWLLYLHTGTRRWHAFLPPQVSYASGDLTADLTFGRFNAPADGYRLAGMIRSCDLLEDHLIRDVLPSPDGVHFVYHPLVDGVHLLCYIRTTGGRDRGEDLALVGGGGVIDYHPGRYVRHNLGNRIRLDDVGGEEVRT